MTSIKTGSKGQRALKRLSAGFLSTVVAVGLTGCDSLLDVENPNNVVQEDLESASAVNAVVNGTLALTSSAIGDVVVSTGALSDELQHTGSQNWAAELDVGSITNPAGRSDALFNGLAEATWMAEEAIRMATSFSAPAADLNRANLYSGILHLTIADNFEDFAFSNRTEVGAPVGEANMNSVYTTAIARLAAAASGGGALGLQARAAQARAEWAAALWPLMQTGTAPASDAAALINDPEANALAAAVLADPLLTTDWAFSLDFDPTTTSNPMGSWINSREEFVIASVYATTDGSGKAVALDTGDRDGDGDTSEVDVVLLDPVTGLPDQAVQEIITDFTDDFLYPDVKITTAKEMHLILAEGFIAQGGAADQQAEDQINAVRALNGVAAYDRTAAGAPSLIDMLKHERRTNLFLMSTRRVWDQYRFNEPDPLWATGSDARTPGQVFVIGQSERISNCFILNNCGG